MPVDPVAQAEAPERQRPPFPILGFELNAII